MEKHSHPTISRSELRAIFDQYVEDLKLHKAKGEAVAHPKYNIYRDEDYERWVATLPCLVCGREGVDVHHIWHRGGKAVRNAYVAVPLCREHHTSGSGAYHNCGHLTFESRWNLDLKDEIIHLLSRYIHERRTKGGLSGR